MGGWGWVGGGARGTGERGRNIESFPANAAPARAGLRTRRRIPTARRGVAGCNAHRVEVTYQMNINKRAQPPPSTPDFSLSLSLSLSLSSSSSLSFSLVYAWGNEFYFRGRGARADTNDCSDSVFPARRTASCCSEPRLWPIEVARGEEDAVVENFLVET